MAESRRKLREQRDELAEVLEAWLTDHDECETGHVPDELADESCRYCDRILWTRAALAKARKQPE